MKNILNIKVLSLLAITILGLNMQAQTLSGLYFLEGNNQRHNLNPAFTSESNYVSFPLLGNVYLGVTSNVGLGTFLVPSGNELVTILHSSISAEDALSNLPNLSSIDTNIGLNILSVGFNKWGGSNNIGINVKSVTGAYIPKELFTFLKEGQTSDVTSYTIPETNIFTQNYAELALGHSRKINDNLTVGAKVKALFGLASAEVKIENMQISMSADEWIIKHNSSLNASNIINLNTGSEGYIDEAELGDIGLGGIGLAIDLGAEYKINDKFKVSVAITDLGFISWSNCSTAYNGEDEYTYTGFDNLEDEDGVDDTLDDLAALVEFYEGEESSKTTSLYTTISAAGEYSILNNKISFGLLGTVTLGTYQTITEAMLSANFRPTTWFNASINGSVSNIASSGGIALNFHPKGINFFIGTDYIIATYNPQFIPIDSSKLNASFGLSFNF